MWTKEITDMIINGVWATLYMTVASTVLGYVFGLPWVYFWQSRIKKD